MTAPTDLGAWGRHHAERIEDLTFMATHGETPAGAAQRLGLSPESLERWCHRHHLGDLWSHLMANNHRLGRIPAGHVTRLVN